jgi:hypothetical protein
MVFAATPPRLGEGRLRATPDVEGGTATPARPRPDAQLMPLVRQQHVRRRPGRLLLQTIHDQRLKRRRDRVLDPE